MKKIFLVFSVLVSLLLGSCTSEFSKHSPYIQVYDSKINNADFAHNDTLFIGDTLQIYAALNPYYNKLVEFNISCDRNYLKDSVFTDEDFETYCDVSKSNRSSGKYVFKNLNAGDILFINPIQFIAINAKNPDTDDIKITFSLESDVDLESTYNPFAFSLNVKIVNPDNNSEE
ncbi:MAG: hypothetical protein EOL95_07470 [Bacteroidia bacterium]|nr:hypothetical protein [Bacteroidia bacterium]